jgi:CRISPR-associated protein Cmr6
MYPYSGPKLIQALEKQHRQRSQSDLFKRGTFTLSWRAKVGSFPHPDLETLISAGEPCGAWASVIVEKRERVNGQWQTYTVQSRPEDKRAVGENWQALRELPLNGYIPGASIRGIVRAWAWQYPHLRPRTLELLGYQNDRTITPGKIEFLDAFPQEPTQLALDIVNPQQDFQVFHNGQGTPLSLYTLGDGQEEIEIMVGIRGIPGKATAEDVQTVWDWVQQALSSQGVGSRRASGYGILEAPADFQLSALSPKLPEGYVTKALSFTLYSQGNAGPDMRTMELRPSHWRGWLRSWLLRFFLGVMLPESAKATVGELLGTLEESLDGTQRKGVVQLQVIPGKVWGKESVDTGFRCFYQWQGILELTAPKEVLNEIILPILRMAVMAGGAGRGWRRPLHRFVMRNGKEATRGCHLEMKHKVKPRGTEQSVSKPFGLALTPEDWQILYERWRSSVQVQWNDRYLAQVPEIAAEVFSPQTCAIYVVPGPDQEPFDRANLSWHRNQPIDTRGEGMELIYQTQYKRQPEMGGNAGEGSAYCSWASIKQVKQQSDCKEVVCLFMGGNHILRSRFLKDLAAIPAAMHVFGTKPPPH